MKLVLGIDNIPPLRFSKKPSRFFPHMLRPLQNLMRCDLSKQLSSVLEQVEGEFPSKKVELSAGEVVLSVFWNRHGFLLKGYLAKGQTSLPLNTSVDVS